MVGFLPNDVLLMSSHNLLSMEKQEKISKFWFIKNALSEACYVHPPIYGEQDIVFGGVTVLA